MFLPEILLWLMNGGWLMLLHLRARSCFPKPLPKDEEQRLIGAMLNGMDSAIMDPLNRDMLGGIYATEALLNLDEYCIEYLSAYREDLFGVQK